MRTIEAEAETPLVNLLDHVERGETVIIKRAGKTIARIMPEGDRRQGEVEQVLVEIDAFRKTMPRLTLDELSAARHEGHDR